MKLISDYKRRVTGSFIPIGKDTILSKIIESDHYLVSAKLDGHLAGLHIVSGKAALYDSRGEPIKVPQVISAAETLFKGKDDCFVAGELYVDDPTRRTRCFDVSAAVADPNDKSLKFAAFDLIHADAISLTIDEKQSLLEKLIPAEGVVHRVHQHKVESRTKIVELFTSIVEENNSEGLVVRSAAGPIYKVKPQHSFDMVVVGYAESDGDRAGMIRELLCAMMDDKGSLRLVAKVGNGFTEEQRKQLLIKLSALNCTADFFEVAGNNVAFQMVRPEIIVQVSCIDIVSEVSAGPVRKMACKFEGAAFVGESVQPSVSLISAVFEGIREDKTFNRHDIRFSQVTDLVDLTGTANATVKLEKSSLLKREVYTKTVKGEIAVRKFLAWKTNKEESGKYPPYVFFYVDFSPSRKDSLQRDIATAQSEQAVFDLFDKSIAENIKKGWERTNA
jgi:ATP-dependent DNA ligase